jgi:hypothetical protein
MARLQVVMDDLTEEDPPGALTSRLTEKRQTLHDNLSAAQKNRESTGRRLECAVENRISKPDFYRLITDEGVAVGGAFDSDTATGMMPAAQRVAGVLTSWRS